MEEQVHNFLSFLRSLAADPESKLTILLSGILLALTSLAIRRKGSTPPEKTSVTVTVPKGESVVVKVSPDSEAI